MGNTTKTITIKSRINTKNAQMFSLDAVIALIIFMGIIVSTYVMWDYVFDKAVLINQANDIDHVSRNAFSVLIETEGDPYNWTDLATFNISNVKSLGLSKISDLELDVDKIRKMAALNSTNYNDYQILLGLQGYDFEILIKVWNNTDYVTQYLIGNTPPENIDRQVSLNRFSILNKTRARVDFNIWQ